MRMLQGRATEELRRLWNGPSETEAWDHLEARGFVLSDCLQYWIAPHEEPHATTGFHYSDVDRSAIAFLHLEWGYPSPQHVLQREETPAPYWSLN
jgi:hypothetical protein